MCEKGEKCFYLHHICDSTFEKQDLYVVSFYIFFLTYDLEYVFQFWMDFQVDTFYMVQKLFDFTPSICTMLATYMIHGATVEARSGQIFLPEKE